jgi:hypothetical protein
MPSDGRRHHSRTPMRCTAGSAGSTGMQAAGHANSTLECTLPAADGWRWVYLSLTWAKLHFHLFSLVWFEMHCAPHCGPPCKIQAPALQLRWLREAVERLTASFRPSVELAS